MQQAEALPARSYELASMQWEIQLILGRYEELATILKQDLLTQHLSNHDRGGIHTTLGIAQFHLNQFSGAARNLTAARKITNKNRGIAGDLDLIHYLAYCYQQLEKPEKESQLLDEADTIIGQVKGEYSNSLKLQVALQHTFRNEISEALALINDVSRDNPVITNLIVTDKRYSAISRSIVSQQALTL